MSDTPTSPEQVPPSGGPRDRPPLAERAPVRERSDAGREADQRHEGALEHPAPADLATLLNALAAGLESGSMKPGSARIPTESPPPESHSAQLHAGNTRHAEQKAPARLEEWLREQQRRSERHDAATDWNSRAIRRAQLAQPGVAGDIARDEEKRRHPAG